MLFLISDILQILTVTYYCMDYFNSQHANSMIVSLLYNYLDLIRL